MEYSLQDVEAKIEQAEQNEDYKEVMRKIDAFFKENSNEKVSLYYSLLLFYGLFQPQHIK